MAGKLWETRGGAMPGWGRRAVKELLGPNRFGGELQPCFVPTHPYCPPHSPLSCPTSSRLPNVLSCKINIPHVLCHIFPGKNSSQGERIFSASFSQLTLPLCICFCLTMIRFKMKTVFVKCTVFHSCRVKGRGLSCFRQLQHHQPCDIVHCQ